MISVKKSATCEIRIGISDLKSDCVDVREFMSSKTYTGPTKKGFLIPADQWGDFVDAVKSFKLDDDESSAAEYLYITTRSKSESHVTKKALDALDNPKTKLSSEPKMPKVEQDGQYLVKCRIKGGNVVSFKRVAKSVGGTWKLY